MAKRRVVREEPDEDPLAELGMSNERYVWPDDEDEREKIEAKATDFLTWSW